MSSAMIFQCARRRVDIVRGMMIVRRVIKGSAMQIEG